MVHIKSNSTNAITARVLISLADLAVGGNLQFWWPVVIVSGSKEAAVEAKEVNQVEHSTLHQQQWDQVYHHRCPIMRMRNSSVCLRHKNYGWQYLRNEKAIGDPLVSKIQFLYFLLDFWLYLGNEKSYQRSTGVKTNGVSRAFQISDWVTRPERLKGAQEEVKQAQRAATKKSGPGGPLDF